MADPKDDIPSHLRHIDKKAAETQRILKELKPEEEKPRRRTGVLVASEDRGPVSPLVRDIEAFIDRLDEAYVTYGGARKQFLKTQLAQARKKDPASVKEILKRENALLDEAEREYRETERARKMAAKKPSLEQTPGFMDKLRWWWYRFRHREWYADGKPSGVLLDHFALQVKGWAADFSPTLSYITDNLYNRDFFQTEAKGNGSAKAYNLMALLGKDHLGRALAKVTSIDGAKSQITEKIRELDDFARIYLQLSLDTSAPAMLHGTLKSIQEKLAAPQKLSPVSKERATLHPTEIERADAALQSFFDDNLKEGGTLPRLLAVYSHLFEREIDAEELAAFLDLGEGIPATRKRLTPAARALNDKWWRDLQAEKKRLTEQARQYESLDAELEFAERIIAAHLDQTATPRERKIYDDDPFSWYNNHILLFLVIFEDLIAGRDRVRLLELKTGGLVLLPHAPPESVKSITSFPIKQDLLGKVKRRENQDPREFRQELWKEGSELFRAHQKAVEHLRKINGRIALHFATLFEREIYRLRDHEGDRLAMHLEDENLKMRVAPYFNVDRTLPVAEGQPPTPVNLHFRDKFGRPLSHDPDSLYALLRLGKSLLTFIAWELKDPNLAERIQSRGELGTHQADVEAHLAVLEDPEQLAEDGPLGMPEG